jgi:hypothetical protein
VLKSIVVHHDGQALAQQLSSGGGLVPMSASGSTVPARQHQELVRDGAAVHLLCCTMDRWTHCRMALLPAFAVEIEVIQG